MLGPSCLFWLALQATWSLCSLGLCAHILLARFARVCFVLTYIYKKCDSGFALCARILGRFAPSDFVLCTYILLDSLRPLKIFENNKCVSIDLKCFETHENILFFSLNMRIAQPYLHHVTPRVQRSVPANRSKTVRARGTHKHRQTHSPSINV